MSTFRMRRGNRAETMARAFLEEQGYHLLDQNVRYPFGELDLVMLTPDRRTLVFVEVRSLGKAAGFHPLETLLPGKLQRLQRAASAYLLRHPDLQSLPVRWDAVAVIWEEPPRLEHYPDCF